MIKYDIIANGAKKLSFVQVIKVVLGKPGFWVAFLYRISSFCYSPIWLRPISKITWLLNILLFGCYISPISKIGTGLCLPHPIGIVIGDDVILGKNVRIYQHVTIGRKNKDKENLPVIKDDVVIYAGAVIIGKVIIGDRVVIGANSVVLKDVPNNAVATGSPAKVI